MNPVSILKISGGEKWLSSISNSIKEFQEAEELCDVTLGCGDQVIQAHGLILSACSSFFKTVLKKAPRSFYHPFIYLSGIDIEDLRGIVTFMYTGVVNVPTDNILRFMEAARELKIEGLSASSEPVSPPQTTNSDQEEFGASRKVEENGKDERKKKERKNDLVSTHSNSNRKRKINETDILVDDSNFEEFERSLLSKLWKDVDEQNRVVWKASILSFKIIVPI